jgi:hypothetical protein
MSYINYSSIDWEQIREDQEMLAESDWTLQHGHQPNPNPNPNAKKLTEEDLSAFSYLQSDKDR